MGSIFLSLLMLPIVSMAMVGDDHQTARENSPKNPHIVFLISKDVHNYKAHKTIPKFARRLEKKHGFESTVLLGSGPRTAHHFSDIEKVKSADLLVIFCRRLALLPQQMNFIKNHLKQGKPLMGIRTANHAFSLRDSLDDGYEDWWDFVPEILGCVNQGYGPVDPGTEVSVNSSSEGHPIIRDVLPKSWHSDGNTYKVAPLVDNSAEVLLYGRYGNQTEPVAWIRETSDQSQVFYTSLGYPTDFNKPVFRTILVNGIKWLLGASKRER